MATLEEEQKARLDLKAVLAELAGIKPSALARKELGDDLSFESGVIYFSRTLRLFQALADADLEDIPYARMLQVTQVAVQARDLFRNIAGFSVAKYSSNPISQRDSFINQARDGYDGMFDIVSPTVAFTIRKGTDFARLEEQAKTTLQRIDAGAEEHGEALQKARRTAEELVDEVRRIAQESGVSQHAVHFKQEADSHEGSARSWLKATVGIALGTVAVGIVFSVIYFNNISTFTPAQSVQLAISKIVILSVLLTATLWAGKTYRAHRHNAVVNRHRQNALSTFRTFAQAASDDQTKNAVLLQATQCIFSPQQTGYIQGESELGGVPQVLEIVRDLGKSK
jgi:hypothetical protein